ncbi:MAG: MFS transporter [Bacteroidetes bacterium]|nr:MFS transporter [Bacteroidota bacterium]
MFKRPTSIFVLCWLSGLASGSVATLVPLYLPSVVQTYTGTTDVATVGHVGSFLQAAFLLGWVTGGILLGAVADRRGRSITLAASLLLACVATALLPSVTTAMLAYALRFITGIGVGSVMVLSTTLAAEVLSDARRPWLMGVLANSYAVGIIATGIAQTKIAEWQTVAYAITGSVVLVPLFMLAGKRSVAARLDADVEPSFGALVRDLRTQRRELIIGSTLFGCILICLWAAFSWLPSWATALHPGVDGGMGLRGKIMIALGLGGIVGSLLSGPLAMRIGRVRTIVVCYVGAIIASLPLYTTDVPSATMMTVSIAVLAIFFGMAQGLMALYIPELFAHHIRATSVGICFNIGRILTAGAVLNIGVLVAAFGGYREALLVFTLPLLVGLVVTRFAHEPKPLSTPVLT